MSRRLCGPHLTPHSRATSTPEAPFPVKISQANLKDLPESTSARSSRGQTKVPQPQSKEEPSRLNHPSAPAIHTPRALPPRHTTPKGVMPSILLHTRPKAEVTEFTFLAPRSLWLGKRIKRRRRRKRAAGSSDGQLSAESRNRLRLLCAPRSIYLINVR